MTRASLAPRNATLASGLTSLLGKVDELLFVLDNGDSFAAASGPLLRLLGMPESAVVGRAAGDVFANSAGVIARGAGRPVRFSCSNGDRCEATLTVSLVPVSNDCALAPQAGTHSTRLPTRLSPACV